MKNTLFTLLLSLLVSISAFAEVRLSSIFTDHMVLQRDQALKIWGWADAKETISLIFNGQNLQSKADKFGFWSVELKPMTYGGPFELNVKGNSNTISLKDILIGDVWIGSGQSNMEWPLINTNQGEVTIANSNNPQIRLFTVDKAMSPEPKQEVDG